MKPSEFAAAEQVARTGNPISRELPRIIWSQNPH
jgi:hypothetical protein